MKFRLNSGFVIDSDEEPFKRTGIRIGIYGDPGSTKSYTAAATFVEPFLEQGGTVVIFQPRSEWHTLKTAFPNIQVVGGTHIPDIPFTALHPKLYADAVVQSGISLIFYTSDAPSIDKLIDFVAKFLDYLMKGLEKTKRPILVLLEEANRYAPLSTRNHPEGAAPWVLGRMIGKLLEMYRDARKLGIVPVSITQRPQDLNFPLRMLCNVSLLGMFSTQDVKYLDKEVLAPMRKNFDFSIDAKDLAKLKAGQWVVLTRSQATKETLTIKRKTPHGADTPEMAFVPQASVEVRQKVTSLAQQLKDLVEKEAKEESETDKLKAKLKSQEERNIELERKVKLGIDLKELLSGSPAKITENVEKRLIELETQNQQLAEANTRLLRESAEAQTREQQLNADLEVVKPMIDFVDHRIEAKLEGMTNKSDPIAQTTQDGNKPTISQYQDWLEKLPSGASQILRLLIERYPMRLTVTQIAQQTAKAPDTIKRGTDYMRTLKRNNLVDENVQGFTVRPM